MDIVSEIKSRLNVEDVVSQYVTLKKSGKNYKGLCPFHQEKTPSFMVSPEKQLAYCFGCHKGGDIINFVEEVEGIEFSEAIKVLADKAGIDPADYQNKVSQKHSKSERDELFDIHNKVAAFYSDLLWNSEKGKKVLEYLRGRGLTDEIIRHFEIGYSPDSFDTTHLHLVKKGFSRKMLSLSGVSISKDTQSNEIYDRFRNRLMFPIKDSMGRIVGFGGRALKKGDEPKYLNSSDSPIYQKSEILYGFSDAKPEIKNKGNILLVEGYFDVIMSYQVGAQNVVASSGTALTLKQIKLIKRLTKDVIFCFDTDEAGIDAAKRGFELAQTEGMNIQMLTVPEAKDPADFIKENGEKWLDTVFQNIPFMEFCINDFKGRFDINSVDGKKKFLKAVLPYIKFLENSVEKDHYIREIAQKIGAKEVQIYDELKKVAKQSQKIASEEVTKNDPTKKKISPINLTLGLIYAYNNILGNYLEKIPHEHFSEQQKNIYNHIKDNYNLLRTEDDVETKKEFLSSLDSDSKRSIELISMFIEEFYSAFNDSMLEKEIERLIEREKKGLSERKRRSLSVQIGEAEKNGNTDEAKALLQELREIVNN